MKHPAWGKIKAAFVRIVDNMDYPDISSWEKKDAEMAAQNMKMKLTSDQYQKEANKILKILECNNNLKKQLQCLNLTEEQMGKFKIDSKKLYLRMKDFYQQLEIGEGNLIRYQMMKAEGFRGSNIEARLIGV